MDGWLLAGLAAGGAIIGAYLLTCAGRRHAPEVQTAVRLLLAAVLVQAAVKLAYLTCTTPAADFGPFEGEDRIYIVVGAVVTAWVALADLYREFRPLVARP